MPQIVKGGKYIFGWSRVGEKGEIVLPVEAVKEYNLSDNLYLLPGSRRSGGFGLTTPELIKDSPFADEVNKSPLAIFSIPEGEPVEINGKSWCWVLFHENKQRICIPVKTLKIYGVNPGDLVLSVRGSRIALGLPVKGPIVEEAKNHPEIGLFEPVG